MEALSQEDFLQIEEGYPITLIPPHGKNVNNYLPLELLKEVLLYSVEVNQMKSGQLASICRYWRSVIISIASLWSTLRVGTWTEREQVTIWLRRAYPRKVVIDTQRDGHTLGDTLQFSALQDALANTGQWHELTISSFPPENLASQLGFRVANPMNMLKALHVTAGCVYSPSFAHLLERIPTEAPLSELRLYPLFASTYFLQPHWFPVLQQLTVLIVNGKDIDEPLSLLPAFTQLQVFEADHLPLPLYEPDTNLPLVLTLQKLQLKATSVQWMAGRVFPCLEECVVLLPHHWEALQQYEVQLPSCRKLAYHGYPMTTIQYFRVPHVKAMELRSHDCDQRRVYQQLQHLCTVDGKISKLTTLHLRLQCSEKVFIKVLKYFGPLQELVLSITHPSPSWQTFLESLAAKPSTKDWPEWDKQRGYQDEQQWEDWYSSQTWYANVLPHLKYLGIKCPKGFSQLECLENSPLFRLIAWTRAQLSSPLEHLNVWEGRGTTENIVDYISSGYLKKHADLGTPNEKYDSMIVRGMVSQRLVIDYSDPPLFHQLHVTALFRQLQALTIYGKFISRFEILILPDLEQIKRLTIQHGTIPAYGLSTRLPLVHTLQWLFLGYSSFCWMIGRRFRALEECTLYRPKGSPDDICGSEGLQVGLPACKILKWKGNYETPNTVFSCPNVQSLQWE